MKQGIETSRTKEHQAGALVAWTTSPFGSVSVSCLHSLCKRASTAAAALSQHTSFEREEKREKSRALGSISIVA